MVVGGRDGDLRVPPFLQQLLLEEKCTSVVNDQWPDLGSLPSNLSFSLQQSLHYALSGQIT